MGEYNELTKRLLKKGYTAKNHPNYVRVAPGGGNKDNPLENFYGGFEYIRIYAEKIVYKTGCGKFIMGKNVLDDFGFGGTEWCHENDNPVFRCPYDKPDCTGNDRKLYGMQGGGLCIQCWCTCHRTNEPYDYENSIEKAEKERKEEKERKYKKYCEAHDGKICRNHMYFNERTRTWSLRYEPAICARMKCYGHNGGAFDEYTPICPILGRELTKEKGNVFYDIKTTALRTDLEGTLFEGQIDTFIEKGIRVFKSPVSMDICRSYVKLCKDDLIRNVRMKYHSELFFAERYGRYFDIEVLNIRAEQRESRDLMQDLQDIKDGIRISHASDVEKRQAEKKKENRKQLKEKKITKMEKRILEVGYGNMDSFEQNRACKLLDFERINELEAMRKENLNKKKNVPVQLSLEEFMKV